MNSARIKGAIITGAAGFIGSHLAERLLNEGVDVIGVDNFITGMKSNIELLNELNGKGKWRFVEADISLPWSNWVEKIPSEIWARLTHVFHFASPASPPHYQEHAFATLNANSIGLKNAIEFADRHSARVVFASTSEVYGNPSVSPQPETYFGNVNSFGPRACYDESKRFGEALIYTSNWKNRTTHGLVRIFNTYGPRMNPDDGRVVINFLVQALKGQPLTVYGTGQQTRSFCYVEDLVEGILRYAKSDCTEPVNIGNDREFTILELTETVRNIFSHLNLKVEYSPLPQDDPLLRRPDLTRTKRKLDGWEPKVTLEEGLKRMLDWLKDFPNHRAKQPSASNTAEKIR